MAEAGEGLGFGGSNSDDKHVAHNAEALSAELSGNETLSLLTKANNGGQEGESLAVAARSNLNAALALAQFKKKRAAEQHKERGTGTPGNFKAVVPPVNREIQAH